MLHEKVKCEYTCKFVAICELKGKHNKAAQQLMLKRNAKQGSCL